MIARRRKTRGGGYQGLVSLPSVLRQRVLTKERKKKEESKKPSRVFARFYRNEMGAWATWQREYRAGDACGMLWL